MPQATPTGGLSLIIHILINIIIFLYKKLLRFFNLPKKNPVSKLFANLINKKGDTFARRLLSYTLVCFVLVIMGGNFILITTRLFKLEDLRLTTKIENIINEKYATNNSSRIVESIEYSPNINFTPIVNTVDQSIQPDIVVKNVPEIQVISLVDFMKSLGIVNTSYQARAELAVTSGIINDTAEYNGSLRQNREIIKKLQEQHNSQIKPE